MLLTGSPSLASGIFWKLLNLSARSLVLGEWGHLIFRQQTDKRCGPDTAVSLPRNLSSAE